MIADCATIKHMLYSDLSNGLTPAGRRKDYQKILWSIIEYMKPAWTAFETEDGDCSIHNYDIKWMARRKNKL